MNVKFIFNSFKMGLKNGNDLNSTLMSKSLFKLLIDRNNVFQIQNCSKYRNFQRKPNELHVSEIESTCTITSFYIVLNITLLVSTEETTEMDRDVLPDLSSSSLQIICLSFRHLFRNMATSVKRNPSLMVQYSTKWIG